MAATSLVTRGLGLRGREEPQGGFWAREHPVGLKHRVMEGAVQKRSPWSRGTNRTGLETLCSLGQEDNRIIFQEN